MNCGGSGSAIKSLPINVTFYCCWHKPQFFCHIQLVLSSSSCVVKSTRRRISSSTTPATLEFFGKKTTRGLMTWKVTKFHPAMLWIFRQLNSPRKCIANEPVRFFPGNQWPIRLESFFMVIRCTNIPMTKPPPFLGNYDEGRVDGKIRCARKRSQTRL